MRAVLSALLLAFVTATGVAAAEIEGVRFAERIEVDGTPLFLNGVGLLRYRIVFKGYVAALYLGEGVSPEDVFGDVPKRLEIEYFWSIDGEQFGPAGDEILEGNVSERTFEAMRPGLARLNRLYPDVKPGDRLALTHLPGKGMTLSKNGRALGTIESERFGREYLRIWLGQEPMSESLRDALLGPREG